MKETESAAVRARVKEERKMLGIAMTWMCVGARAIAAEHVGAGGKRVMLAASRRREDRPNKCCILKNSIT